MCQVLLFYLWNKGQHGVSEIWGSIESKVLGSNKREGLLSLDKKKKNSLSIQEIWVRAKKDTIRI